mmetsp:Transcript_10308/g.31522  ORF Transcript_10308/g.31522 Transcript_10308/m.31522 type:complete len:664 (-) Transcript_10308:154-2145(-)|eukprot:CAMPEP_0198735664 /NCGR_PEP_ID=MMETSP1475-20131203/61166_1 /TAXON_ID= ORGANISM="Unidentified sp., Strain CCMP1999" /NCGR_SAMPLE_ID=MMETSP1475 /ASSEMBLY_ACC=CAM_ASM_001111 /LENGTH=663 /DNA_ID=CAMNT_0044499361 /DNA_START=270 /DNA_END=2261 /DNA_ORIENTATION=-
MSSLLDKNVYSFNVRKIEKTRKLLKDLGFERSKQRRLEVNADVGKVRVSSVKNDDRATEYLVVDLVKIERLKIASCVRIVTSDSKELCFKFESKAGLEMFCDLLLSLREDLVLGSNGKGIGRLSNADSPNESRGMASVRSNSPEPGELRNSDIHGDSPCLRSSSPQGNYGSRQAQERVAARPESAKIYCTTFNMGDARPPTQAIMRKWIPILDPEIHWKPSALFDVYAIGVQERAYDVEVSTSREHWRDSLSALFPDDLFSCLAHIDSWDRSLSIFVRNELESRILHLEADTVNVGVGGVAGNKGAIGVKFTLYDTTFCFVNSHLAAHQYEIAKRNADFSEIVRALKLRDSPTTDVTTSVYHHVFWMGDLNYRISVNRDLCVDLIRGDKWNYLRSMDQLTSARNTGKVFCGFQEGDLSHPPSYKLARGDLFDDIGRRVYSEERSRIPAWTDRILYKTLPGSSIELLEYGSVNFVTTSDHTPVYALFQSGMTHTSGLRSVSTMLRIAQLEDPFYIHFATVKAKPTRSEEPLGTGDIVLMFDPKILVNDKHVRSMAKKDTVTPVWNREDLPRLCTIENKPELLAKKHLQITVKSRDFGTKTSKKQDFIASTIVWLGAEPNEDGDITFEEPLLRNGVKVGCIEGMFRLTQDDNCPEEWTSLSLSDK